MLLLSRIQVQRHLKSQILRYKFSDLVDGILGKTMWHANTRLSQRRRDAIMLRWAIITRICFPPSPPCVAYKALLELALNATVAAVACHHKY